MNWPEVDYQTSIENVGLRIVQIQLEHWVFEEKQRIQTRDLVFRYCRWGEYQPKPISKNVRDHLVEF